MNDTLVSAAPFTVAFSYRVAKRAIDVLVAALMLVVLSPLLAAIAIAVKLAAPGWPAFYPWPVVGLEGRPFTGYKFRTMVPNAESLLPELLDRNEMTGPAFKMSNDPRVTRLGRLLRKYSLDELPQLWSVLVGDMSLVGPHPPLQSEWAQFEPWHRRKLSVKPGISCIWQVKGRGRLRDFDDWVRLDLEYIDKWSFWRDFRLLLQLVPAVLRGTGK